MNRKYFPIFAALVASAAILSGCGKSHTHQLADNWEVDLNNHWMVCTECKETAEKGAHTPDESDTCTVCGAQILDWGDAKSVYLFKEDGNLLKSADYDESGKLITETVCEYTYNSDGEPASSVTKVDGTVTEETVYTTVDGESIISRYTIYMDDGSKSAGDYDEYGNVTHTTYYDADGNITATDDSEYALSADGEWYEAKCTETEADGSKRTGEYAENGDQTALTSYDADNNIVYSIRWEYSYDENGNRQSINCYFNDKLMSESIYATQTTADGSVTYPETTTEYDDDGGKTVTVRDADDNIISQTRYDPNGNVIPE